MTADELATLCHRASLELSLPDPYTLGKGHTVTLDGVHIEIQHKAPRPHFLLLAEIAKFPDTQRAAVHEHLLTLQLSTADHPNLRFGFHPKRHTTLVCLTSTPPRGDSSPEAWLVSLLRDTVQQVRAWRRELRELLPQTQDDRSGPAVLQHASQFA
ncbi:hypothetical protein [uncultured Hydrogenophaga sp.]|uniref:hypothetical protein n=1 Tax=uncultured Hydrogenophaga sp. TaxID=199683 RepID=UPI0025830102|nr:hypothetical protein [uncultured Hydrogenophaga sp.]